MLGVFILPSSKLALCLSVRQSYSGLLPMILSYVPMIWRWRCSHPIWGKVPAYVAWLCLLRTTVLAPVMQRQNTQCKTISTKKVPMCWLYLRTNLQHRRQCHVWVSFILQVRDVLPFKSVTRCSEKCGYSARPVQIRVYTQRHKDGTQIRVYITKTERTMRNTCWLTWGNALRRWESRYR